MLDPTDTHYRRISYRRPFMKKTFMTKNRYDSPNAELAWLIQELCQYGCIRMGEGGRSDNGNGGARYASRYPAPPSIRGVSEAAAHVLKMTAS